MLNPVTAFFQSWLLALSSIIIQYYLLTLPSPLHYSLITFPDWIPSLTFLPFLSVGHCWSIHHACFCHCGLIVWVQLGYMFCTPRCWVPILALDEQWSHLYVIYSEYATRPPAVFLVHSVSVPQGNLNHHVIPTALIPSGTHWFLLFCLVAFHPQKKDEMYLCIEHCVMSVCCCCILFMITRDISKHLITKVCSYTVISLLGAICHMVWRPCRE